jgi:hypothetical protein
MRVLGFALMGALPALADSACSESSVTPEAGGGLRGNSEAARGGRAALVIAIDLDPTAGVARQRSVVAPEQS